MSSVDEILASGRYTDRRGRRFGQTHTLTGFCDEWILWWPRPEGYRHPLISYNQMRLLIERDRHRSECVGLHDCYVHPTPRILFHDGLWRVVAPGLQAWKDTRHVEFADAWDAARALAARP